MTEHGTDASHPALAWWDRHRSQLALAAFVAYLAAGFALLLFRYGAGSWFAGDDWGMLDGRSLWSPADLLRPQNGHWSTVPVVVYQVLYRIVGLRTYVPYMAVTVLLHLTLVCLLRVIMRRAGVGPWMATFVAGSFVLFGAGYENLLLAIQVSMVGSLVFGLTHVLLADHDGPFGRRDALGLVAGLLALMASSVGIAMVVAVGATVLIRRGWRLALLHTAPLGVVFGAWYAWQRSVGRGGAENLGSGGITTLATWVAGMIAGSFAALGQHLGVAIALGVILVAGCALAWVPLDRPELRRVAGVPGGLLIGAVALATLIGSQRAAVAAGDVFHGAQVGRYVAMTTALTLPALGVAAAALARRWRATAPVVVVLLAIGIPGNLAAFDGRGPAFSAQGFEQMRRFVLSVPASPVARDVPRDVHPNPNELTTADLTVGFLLQARKDGRLPDDIEPTAAELQQVTTRLGLSQALTEEPTPAATCTTQTAPLTVPADAGDRFVLGSPVRIARIEASGEPTAATTYNLVWSGATLTANLDDQVFVVSPVAPATTFRWCTVP